MRFATLQGKELDVESVGTDLQITGLFPSYRGEGFPCDLIRQYEKFPRQLAIGQKTNGVQSPEMFFANADTDEKLIAFVRRFGPVVAKCVKDTRMIPAPELGRPRFPGRLIAQQDMQELRNERTVYCSALALVMQLGQPNYDYDSAQQLIKTIAENIQDWPRQWERERSLRAEPKWPTEPKWNLSAESLKRIDVLSSTPSNPIFSDYLSGRIIICELLNSFPSIVFPNPLEMHNSIMFGIRPLLYSLLGRQLFYPRGFSVCLNTECRSFFNIDRASQQFCSPECSLRHRQRIYWQERGSKLRKKRATQRRKVGK